MFTFRLKEDAVCTKMLYVHVFMYVFIYVHTYACMCLAVTGKIHVCYIHVIGCVRERFVQIFFRIVISMSCINQ